MPLFSKHVKLGDLFPHHLASRLRIQNGKGVLEEAFLRRKSLGRWREDCKQGGKAEGLIGPGAVAQRVPCMTLGMLGDFRERRELWNRWIFQVDEYGSNKCKTI